MGALTPWAPAIWVALGMLGGIVLTSLTLAALAIRDAEPGIDPFAALPTFDDAEAQQLLEQGA